MPGNRLQHTRQFIWVHNAANGRRIRIWNSRVWLSGPVLWSLHTHCLSVVGEQSDSGDRRGSAWWPHPLWLWNEVGESYYETYESIFLALSSSLLHRWDKPGCSTCHLALASERHTHPPSVLGNRGFWEGELRAPPDLAHSCPLFLHPCLYFDPTWCCGLWVSN